MYLLCWAFSRRVACELNIAKAHSYNACVVRLICYCDTNLITLSMKELPVSFGMMLSATDSFCLNQLVLNAVSPVHSFRRM